MAELHVSKKTIGKLFGEMQNRKFVIPDYQRPYKWDTEKCETLWNDIENFAITEAKTDTDYFLGTIVSYTNDNNQEVIDGQQRITSLLLMLRAFYKKLEDMIEDEDVIGLKNQLAPCIWDINPISQKISDKTKIHVESLVATEDDNDMFHKILETGNSDEDSHDSYSENYRFFKAQCDEYAEKNPLQWKQLCVTILQKCIILPIECITQDTALTIFSTLNDRGMPLADSDIFKAQLYRNCDTEEKRKEFTQTWKELTQICKRANTSLDNIFRYYTHVLRARGNDKSREIGLRSFYATNKYEKLKDNNLLDEIILLANFWLYINTGIEPNEEDRYKISIENRKYLHCLFCYPNDYWKYVVSVFFIKNKNNDTFDNDLNILLKKLSAFLLAKFIETPSVNAIKDDIFAACISIQNNNEFQVKFILDEELILARIGSYASSKISKALLLLDAYLNPDQKNLIPDTFDIEHIFPKKWQDTNYSGWELEDAEQYLNSFGNKIVFEKKLNIQAGNNYFGIKKQKYAQSKIVSVVELSSYPSNDWLKEDIEKREKEFKERLIDFFKRYHADN
ncbi:MAG: DUF262 domain-containing HNH endonuclease family protein [Campylobacteraceae bacterium]|jgi:uncharacterized protein with ParB-like and HNH nuclease domain|nr:DUF262 domain-containing HNH endonuclease family protein [Campylobacteraceae bacterium]